MLKKRLTWLLLTMGFSLVAVAGNSFTIAPTHVVQDLSSPHTLVYLVKNTGDAPIHIRMNAEFLPLGSEQYNRGKSLLTPEEEKATDLSPYVLISPRALSLMPAETREVRVSVRAPHALTLGTYRTHLTASMLEFANQTNSTQKIDNENLGIQINMLLKIATALYGNMGKPVVSPTFTCVKEKDHLRILATNSSPWHLTAEVQGIFNQETTPVFKMQADIYRNSESYIDTTWNPTKQGELVFTWKDVYSTQSGKATCSV